MENKSDFFFIYLIKCLKVFKRKENQNPIFFNIKLYNKYYIIYHMSIRHKYVSYEIMYTYTYSI